jgi:hypothetical protein
VGLIPVRVMVCDVCGGGGNDVCGGLRGSMIRGSGASPPCCDGWKVST